MPIDLAIFGPEGRYKYVTPSAVSDAERRRQVIGMTDVEYARLRGHDVDTARTRLETIRRVARTREMEQFEETLEEASGRSRHFIRFVMPVVQDGAVRSVLGYGMEITKRKQAEMELRDAKEQAEASLAAKERFLATMSHEVRTPLNAVLGMAQLLARTELSEQQRSYLQSIHFSGDTLLTLLNTVLDFAKLEAGEVDLDEAAFDPARLAHHVRDMLRSKAEENQLDFRVETDPELPASVVGDAARVGQILTNLGSNALKFTPDGSVVLHVETAPSVEHADAPEPTTEGADAPTWITFRVEDTGRGIAPDQQDRIFGHFNQADVGAEEAREGTGLGLAIVQTLVDQMGGTIDVQSTPGEGSTFSVHLPFAAQGAGPEREATGDEDGGFGEAGSGSPTAPSPAAAPPARAAEGDALSGLDVLVVEDNATNQVVVRDLLLGWGTRVDVAADGQAALERLRSAHYDLVLMDIQMPRMDGLEATRRLRRDLECDLPVVALTASMRRENRDEVFAAGMDAFVSKPFKPATLYQTLTRQVSGSSPSSSSGSSSSSTPAGPTPAGSAPAAPEDLALVDLGFLRENMSDPQAVRDVATALLDQIGTFLDDLSAARRDQDEDRLGALFHRLKSAAQMAGAERLGQHAQALDRTDPPYDTDRLDDVARVARRTRTALDDRLHVLADTVSR
jgi:signal transduction histidine kinase/CheY-like chemotaxis protein/HPt (histidine-containing phosphotransfer) domain-containing protein